MLALISENHNATKPTLSVTQASWPLKRVDGAMITEDAYILLDDTQIGTKTNQAVMVCIC